MDSPLVLTIQPYFNIDSCNMMYYYTEGSSEFEFEHVTRTEERVSKGRV